MAADWRGWRLIVVNGERFRWQVVYFWNGSISVRVRPETMPGALLVVYNCDGLPRVVEHWIEVAAVRDWPNSVRNLELDVGIDLDPLPGADRPHTDQSSH